MVAKITVLKHPQPKFCHFSNQIKNDKGSIISIILTIIQAPGKGPVKAQDYLRSKGELFKIGSKL